MAEYQVRVVQATLRLTSLHQTGNVTLLKTIPPLLRLLAALPALDDSELTKISEAMKPRKSPHTEEYLQEDVSVSKSVSEKTESSEGKPETADSHSDVSSMVELEAPSELDKVAATILYGSV